MKNISIQEMAKLFEMYNDYRIVYHVRPDGDCIGSAYALALALQSIGKKCDVKGEYSVPKAYQYLTDKVVLNDVSEPVYIAVDSSSSDRLGTFQNERYTFCIDHHHDNSIKAEYKYVEVDCGACSEIIFKLIQCMKINMTKDMADLLYTALVTDTMCFRTSDVSQQSFETAAALAGYGADVCNIARRHMFLKSPQRVKIENILKNSFHFTCDDRICTGIITLNDLQNAGIEDEDLEGINSLVDEIDSVEIGVTIRELPDKTLTRCSMRTKGNISANEICKALGGGGHEHAAACYLPNVDVYQAREKIEEVCRKFLFMSIKNNIKTD